MEKIYIDGQWVDGASGDYIEVENPATMDIIGRVVAGHEEDVDKAVRAAKDAFIEWSNTDIAYRIDLMEEFLRKLKNSSEKFADIIVRELGSAYMWALNTQVKNYFSEIEDFIENARDFRYIERGEGDFTVVREPVGVVACITPWNYPLGQVIRKIVPALLSGNTVVLKPSQQTPYTAIELVRIMDEVGFPQGVINLVTGRGSEVGNYLTTHKDVDMISFTGSVSGGISVGKSGMDSVKKLALELGGKSPAIIIPGADLDNALRQTLDKIFMNVGQTCSALSRLLVHKDHLDEVLENIKEMMPDYSVGNPFSKEVALGSLSSRKQYDKVRRYIKLGLEEGATMFIGSVPEEEPQDGYFVEPVVFTDVKNSMRIAREEIFGPVLCIMTYDLISEAVDMANDTDFGLNAAVFAPTYEEAIEIAMKIKSGNVVVNYGGSRVGVPFGGYKHSGIGRECGKFGMEEFMEVKGIIGWKI